MRLCAKLGSLHPLMTLRYTIQSYVQGCSLEPNLGIHNYHQKRTRDDLKGRHWLCFNNQLILSDLDGMLFFLNVCLLGNLTCVFSPLKRRQKSKMVAALCQVAITQRSLVRILISYETNHSSIVKFKS